MSDVGLTHVAFAAADLEKSISFYGRYAGMMVVHRRADPGASHVAWVSDLTRPFALVLIQAPGLHDTPLGPFGHLGVACQSREDVDRLAELARSEGCLLSPPVDAGPVVGYFTLLQDPDGNTLELAYGQEVAFTVEATSKRS